MKKAADLFDFAAPRASARDTAPRASARDTRKEAGGRGDYTAKDIEVLDALRSFQSVYGSLTY